MVEKIEVLVACLTGSEKSYSRDIATDLNAIFRRDQRLKHFKAVFTGISILIPTERNTGWKGNLRLSDERIKKAGIIVPLYSRADAHSGDWKRFHALVAGKPQLSILYRPKPRMLSKERTAEDIAKWISSLEAPSPEKIGFRKLISKLAAKIFKKSSSSR